MENKRKIGKLCMMCERRMAIMLLLTMIVTAVLGGCSGSSTTRGAVETGVENQTSVEAVESEMDDSEEVTELQVETEPYSELSDTQKNSISMMNYLAITAEKIYTAKNSRLLLDDIYTELFNELNPGAIDEKTQEHLGELRGTIKELLKIDVKRERVTYLYNQEKAKMIKNALPIDASSLKMVSSIATKGELDWFLLGTSIALTIVDSFNNYLDGNDVEKEYLTSGWELDDKEIKAIQDNREAVFNYMIDVVQEQDLTESQKNEFGKLTLKETAIKNFAKICTVEDVYQKKVQLEAAEHTYQWLGDYWLELVDCYYQIGEYQKCLDCVAKYDEVSSDIFRVDTKIVTVLPKAIVAAQEVYSGDEYINKIQAFADRIISGVEDDEWAPRYFVAQVYIDLYSKTDDTGYLEKAYGIVKTNVAHLVEQQESLNDVYLAEVQEIEYHEPDYGEVSKEEKSNLQKEYKEEKKRVDSYNKLLKETRKTEVPSLYEPLILNCDLLFALAEELHIDQSEKIDIQGVLKTNTNGVFLSKPVNERYSFDLDVPACELVFDKNTMVIPADYLTQNTTIVVTVANDTETTVYDDWKVKKVERSGNSVSDYLAYISSEAIKEIEWSVGTEVIIEIYCGEGYEAFVMKYRVTEYEHKVIGADTITFEPM